MRYAGAFRMRISFGGCDGFMVCHGLLIYFSIAILHLELRSLIIYDGAGSLNVESFFRITKCYGKLV